MNTIIFHTKMVDSLVEMLVETSDLSIFWYVVIFFKLEFEIFIIERYVSWLLYISVLLKTVLIRDSKNKKNREQPASSEVYYVGILCMFLILYKSTSYWCEFVFLHFLWSSEEQSLQIVSLKEKKIWIGVK